MTSIERAVEVAGGPSALAAAISVSPQVINNWKARGQCSAAYCAAIETATGGQVTRYDLRPDVFGEQPDQAKAA